MPASCLSLAAVAEKRRADIAESSRERERRRAQNGRYRQRQRESRVAAHRPCHPRRSGSGNLAPGAPAGPDGLLTLRHRIYRGRPSPRARVQLRAGPAAPGNAEIRRAVGTSRRRYPATRTRTPGRRGGDVPVRRQCEGGGDRLPRRRASLQCARVPGVRHALRLSSGRLPTASAPNEGESGATIPLCGNQPAQRSDVPDHGRISTAVGAASCGSADVADVEITARPNRRRWNGTRWSNPI